MAVGGAGVAFTAYVLPSIATAIGSFKLFVFAGVVAANAYIIFPSMILGFGVIVGSISIIALTTICIMKSKFKNFFPVNKEYWEVFNMNGIAIELQADIFDCLYKLSQEIKTAEDYGKLGIKFTNTNNAGAEIIVMDQNIQKLLETWKTKKKDLKKKLIEFLPDIFFIEKKKKIKQTIADFNKSVKTLNQNIAKWVSNNNDRINDLKDNNNTIIDLRKQVNQTYVELKSIMQLTRKNNVKISKFINYVKIPGIAKVKNKEAFLIKEKKNKDEITTETEKNIL